MGSMWRRPLQRRGRSADPGRVRPSRHSVVALVTTTIVVALAAARGLPWLRGQDDGTAVAFVAAAIMSVLVLATTAVGFHVHRQAARRDSSLRDPEEVYTPEAVHPRLPSGHLVAMVAGYLSVFTLLGALFALPAGILGAMSGRSGSLTIVCVGVLCAVCSVTSSARPPGA